MTKRVVCLSSPRAFGGRDIPNGYRAARALAEAGHDVSVMDHAVATPAALAGSDLVLAFGTIVSAEAKQPGTFARLRRITPAALALWYFDYANPAMRNSPWKFPTLKRIVPRLDLLATTDHSWPWETIAHRYLHLPQGIDPREFDFIVNPPEPRRHDVLFTGGTGPGFEYRTADLAALRGRFDVAWFGRDRQNSIFGRRRFDEYQRSRIAYVPAPPPECGGHYWSNRIYIATATGTPCLVGWTPGIDDHFAADAEVVYFRDRAELVERAGALITDPAARARIGEAGRRRTLITHTYRKRIDILMEAIWPTNRK